MAIASAVRSETAAWAAGRAAAPIGTPVATCRIGTRGSALAMTQARFVAAALQETSPGLAVELVLITTTGDRSQQTLEPGPAWGQGVFVKEIEQALLRGEIDLAVHSLKDLPPAMAEGLVLAAVPTREDPRDVLLTREGLSLDDLAPGAVVGTSSARRSAFLRSARPNLVMRPLRGNVDTRCRKLLDGEVDAIVLAYAGLARLGIAVPRVFLPVQTMLPAPGQGALGLQVRADDARMRGLVAPLDDPATAAAVRAERQFMADLDADCRLPLGALAEVQADGWLVMQAAAAPPDGHMLVRARGNGPSTSPELLGSRLAAQFRQRGVASLMRDSAEATA